jgi:hypothetical protein
MTAASGESRYQNLFGGVLLLGLAESLVPGVLDLLKHAYIRFVSSFVIMRMTMK